MWTVTYKTRQTGQEVSGKNNINTVSASRGEVERHRKEQVKNTGMLKSICYLKKKNPPGDRHLGPADAGFA